MFLPFHVCPCKEKYTWEKPILEYFRIKSKSWIDDPQDKYSFNYVIIILLATLKENNSAVKKPKSWDTYQITDSELARILRFSQFTLYNLRIQMRGLCSEKACEEPDLGYIFYCVPDIEQFNLWPFTQKRLMCESEDGH